MTEPTQNNERGNSLQLKILQHGQQYLSSRVLAKVLTVLGDALESFLLAEIRQSHSHPKTALKKEMARFASETRLAMTGADSEHFTFIFQVVYAKEEPTFRLLKDVPDLQQQLFALFIQAVFTPVLFNREHTGLIAKRYQAKERTRIFGPIYSHLVNPEGYHVFCGGKRKCV